MLSCPPCLRLEFVFLSHVLSHLIICSGLAVTRSLSLFLSACLPRSTFPPPSVAVLTLSHSHVISVLVALSLLHLSLSPSVSFSPSFPSLCLSLRVSLFPVYFSSVSVGNFSWLFIDVQQWRQTFPHIKHSPAIIPLSCWHLELCFWVLSPPFPRTNSPNELATHPEWLWFKQHHFQLIARPSRKLNSDWLEGARYSDIWALPAAGEVWMNIIISGIRLW